MNLGHYEVQGELGRGGMGVVYRALDPILRREVAIKVLQAASVDAEAMARFQREAQTASTLRHDGIVPVHAAGLERGRPYLVMDLVRGESLREVVRREGPLPEERAATLVRDVARALQHAHERGVLHRDVKPENVLLDQAGRPRLTDFGLASILGDSGRLTRDGEVVGTPCYMAPEQALGDRGQVGPWSDVYGLGAVLYELLTGQPPFAGASAMSALESTVRGRVSSPRLLRRDLDVALEVCCMKALARDPVERFQRAGELAEALEAWLVKRAAARAKRPPAQGPAALVLGATAALLLATSAGLTWALLRERARAAERTAELEQLARRVAELEAARAAPVATLPPRATETETETPTAPPATETPPIAPVATPRPRDPEVARLCHETRVLAGRGVYAEALPLAERAVRLDPDDVEALNNLGAVYLGGGDPRRAVEHLDRALELDPGYGLALANRAQARLSLRDAKGAIDDTTRALDLVPTDARLHRLRGLARETGGDSRGALVDLSRAVELDPNLALAWRERGILRGRFDDHRGAIADYERALALEPDDATTYSNLGVARAELGDHLRGAADIERALALGVSDPAHTLGNLGAIFQLADDHLRAVEALTRSLEHDPTQAVVLANRGISRGRLGDHAGAIDDCTRALTTLPRGSKKAREAEQALAAAREALGAR
jgi:tetratricopeptide (TPR) repeat protein/predicted Ser/Thr protein kinase